MLLRSAVFAAALLACAIPTTAQQIPVDSARAPVAVPDSVAARYLGTDLRSPARAGTLSFLNTAIPLVLAAALSESNSELAPYLGLYGVFVGPSVGHFYGQTGRGMSGILMRSGGAVLIVIGAGIALDNLFTETNSGDEALIAALVFGGMAVIGGSALYDVFTAGSATQRANARRLGQRRAQLRGGPTSLRVPGGLSHGAALTLRF